jgi:hypothetical protein
MVRPFLLYLYFMGPVEYLERVRRINVPEAAQKAIQRTGSVYSDLQREQLFQGLSQNDEPIVPPYSGSTVSRKKKKGQPYDRVTLRDTGSYYSGISIEVTGDKIIIGSSDEKDADLSKRYGRNLLGLGPGKMTEYVPVLLPIFISEIKNQMR